MLKDFPLSTGQEKILAINSIYAHAKDSAWGAATIRHPDIRVKHGYIWAFTHTAVILYTDVLFYKTESFSKIMFRRKVL
jgi:hypothetical protein